MHRKYVQINETPYGYFLCAMPGTAMLVLPAMMLPAGMTVLVAMMIALYIGIEVQVAGLKGSKKI